jgi:UDP-N-acetylglucosamine 2-epimerase (non-hydrolysing)
VKQSNKKKVFCIAGTRPEYIKLFPVYKELKSFQDKLDIFWVSSGQHKDLVKSLEELFSISPDFSIDLELLESSDLALRASFLLKSFAELFEVNEPDLIVVQGDTITAEKAALAAFYQGGIKIAHVEAGLRSFNIHAPFPEELSRRLIDQISNLNFAPTKSALDNLINESNLFKHNSENFLVGNTVVDSLNTTRELISSENFDWNYYSKAKLAFEDIKIDISSLIQEQQKFVLITLHRRENFEESSKNLIQALLKLAQKFKSINFILSLHPSSRVINGFAPLNDEIKQENYNNIFLLTSLAYPVFIKLMMNCEFIISDSGGIQEEAHYLYKTVLVLRNETERIEGIEQGLNKLTGIDQSSIYDGASSLLENSEVDKNLNFKNIYGDGSSSKKIAKIIFESLSK